MDFAETPPNGKHPLGAYWVSDCEEGAVVVAPLPFSTFVTRPNPSNVVRFQIAPVSVDVSTAVCWFKLG
jgi:hypothetical protein